LGILRLKFATFLWFALWSILLAGNAYADFRVCNGTQSLVGVAVGYRSQEGWVSEGWWRIDPSHCKTIIKGVLKSRYYYVYAEDAVRGSKWEGPIKMCVADKSFKISGVHDCFARGFQKASFQEYDTGEQTNWMVQLTEDTNNSSPLTNQPSN
jgi:uncharacterized membrane protein